LSLPEQIRLCDEIGVEFVEIVAEIFWGLPGDRSRWSEIKSALEKVSVEPILHAAYIELNMASIRDRIAKAAVDECRLCLEIAEYLGARYMVIHPGNLNRNFPPSFINRARDNLVNSLRDLVEEAQNRKVMMALENGWNGENHPVIDCVEVHREIIERVSSPYLRALVDVGHVNTFGADIIEYIESLKDLIVGFHIHDNDGTKDQHLPPGSGSIDDDVYEHCLRQDVPSVIEVNSLEDIYKAFNYLKSLS